MTSKWLTSQSFVVYALSLLSLMEIIDLTVVNVSLPQIMAALDIDMDHASLVSTSYIIAAAIFNSLTGILAKRFGLKRLILGSSILFGFFSIMCGVAENIHEMMTFRFFQGMGGAFLPACAQSYIAQEFKDDDYKKMMTILSAVMVLGPVIGPVVAAYLIEFANWRFIFYVNVPFCILGYWVVWQFMQNSVGKKCNFDALSFGFLFFGVGLLEYVIDEGNAQNWFESPELVIMLSLSIYFLCLFVLRAKRGHSVINFQLFYHKNFMLNCMMVFAFSILALGPLSFYSNFMQETYHYSILGAGQLSLIRGIAALGMVPVAGLLSKYYGSRETCILGMFLSFISYCLFSHFSLKMNETYIILASMVQGAGLMAFFVPALSLTMIDLPESLKEDAAGIFNFFRNFACSIGVSISATTISHVSRLNQQILGNYVQKTSKGFILLQQQLHGFSGLLQLQMIKSELMLQSRYLSYLELYGLFSIGFMTIFFIPVLLKKPTYENSLIQSLERK